MNFYKDVIAFLSIPQCIPGVIQDKLIYLWSFGSITNYKRINKHSLKIKKQKQKQNKTKSKNKKQKQNKKEKMKRFIFSLVATFSLIKDIDSIFALKSLHFEV